MADRISELPDIALLHIMSFVDAKSAIQTCVLSKRWRYLCKCLTSLTFQLPIGYPGHTVEQFVYWLLHDRDHSYSLLNLTIDCPGFDLDSMFVDKVIEYALCHNIQQLKMSTLSDTTNFEFLPLIFSSQSLKSLDLGIKLFPWVLELPKSLNMPALKSLHFSYVRFIASDNGHVEPFSNCHELNTLVLKHFSLQTDKQVLCISNPTLSSLTIQSILEGQAYQIALSTPKLTSFTIKGSISHQLSSTCNLSFLDEVGIMVYEDKTAWHGKTSIIIEWLQVLANVKILTLSIRTCQIMLHDLSNPASMIPQPPCFVRLRTLKVKKHLLANILDEQVNKAAEYLLQNSPMARVDIITNA